MATKIVHVYRKVSTGWGGHLFRRFCNMFSRSSPCLLGQHGSCSIAQWSVELSENMLQNLLLNLPPQTVEVFRIFFSEFPRLEGRYCS